MLLWQRYSDIMCYVSAQGGAGAGLGDMFGQLDLGSEEGEDQLMKMMQGMMSTLLSKEVLYPSLKELCKQVRCLEGGWVGGSGMGGVYDQPQGAMYAVIQSLASTVIRNSH